jgi:hypothetical protein
VAGASEWRSVDGGARPSSDIGRSFLIGAI